MNSKVDFFFEKPGKWQESYRKLRTIILGTGLTEELKWGCPCYTYKGVNVVLIHGFKEYCALLFHKGVLLNDPDKLLIQQTENVQSARQMRFTNVKEVEALTSSIKNYVFESMELEKAGLKVEFKETRAFNMPEEFKEYLEGDAELKKAFESLTPGRQRGYLLHFSQPKQSKTRISRIEKAIPHIFDGKGLNDIR